MEADSGDDAFLLISSEASSDTSFPRGHRPSRGTTAVASLLIGAGVVLLALGAAGATFAPGGRGKVAGVATVPELDDRPGFHSRAEPSEEHRHERHDRSSVQPMPMPTGRLEFAPARCETVYRLDELARWASTWCYPRRGADIPRKLQGLFWLKDLPLEDVAACFSLGSWDARSRTLSLEVATSFVFKNRWAGRRLASSIASTGTYYDFKFSDRDLTRADIHPRGQGLGTLNMKVFDAVSSFPLKEEASSHGTGDMWERPSYFGGVYTYTYYVWRILDPNLNVVRHRARRMEEELRKHWDGTLIRYHDHGC